MPVPPPRPRRGRAVVVLLTAIAAGLALATVRRHVDAPPGLAPADAALVEAAQWALWLLADYVVAAVAVSSGLVVVQRRARARAPHVFVAPMLRPAIAALLGVAITAGPAAAASPQPPPAVVVGDPFDWVAPADSLAGAVSQFAVVAASSGGRRAPPHPRDARTVRVGIGDCLWSLAARDLAARHLPDRPADVAAAWRRWYAVNRTTIGADPALLRPGEVLHVPAAAAAESVTRTARRHP